MPTDVSRCQPMSADVSREDRQGFGRLSDGFRQGKNLTVELATP